MIDAFGFMFVSKYIYAICDMMKEFLCQRLQGPNNFLRVFFSLQTKTYSKTNLIFFIELSDCRKKCTEENFQTICYGLISSGAYSWQTFYGESFTSIDSCLIQKLQTNVQEMSGSMLNMESSSHAAI